MPAGHILVTITKMGKLCVCQATPRGPANSLSRHRRVVSAQTSFQALNGKHTFNNQRTCRPLPLLKKPAEGGY